MDVETAADGDALRWVMRDQVLGPASKLAYRFVFQLAAEAGRPEVVTTASDLARECGCRSPRAAWKWLRELERHGLVAIADRDRRRGTILLYVYKPFPGQLMQHPDPQRLLQFAASDSGPGGADVGALEGPRADVCAPERPRGDSAENAEKPALDRRWADVCAPERPRPSLNAKETRSSLMPKCQREDQRFIDNEDFCAEHVDAAGVVHGVGPVSGDVAAALRDFTKATNPRQQKTRLKTHIQQVCRGPDAVADWAAGAAADLVVFHGLPVERIEAILGDVEAMRAAGSLRSAGRLFTAKCQALLEEAPYANIGSPLRRKQAGETEQQP